MAPIVAPASAPVSRLRAKNLRSNDALPRTASPDLSLSVPHGASET
jgi:hypothetical protein